MGKPKDGNLIIQVTLVPYHVKKLDLMCKRTGLSRSAIIQRLIENHDLFKENKQ